MKRAGYVPVTLGAETLQATLPADTGLYTAEATQEPVRYVYGASSARAAWRGSGEQPPCLDGGTQGAAETAMIAAVAIMNSYVLLHTQPSSTRNGLRDSIDPAKLEVEVIEPATKLLTYCGGCAVTGCDIKNPISKITDRRARNKQHNQKGPESPA